MICNQLANYFQQKLDIPISESQNNYLYLRKNTRYHSSQITLESSPPDLQPLGRVCKIQKPWVWEARGAEEAEEAWGKSAPAPLHRVVCRQTLVESVALELGALPLHQNILRLAQKATAMGQKNLVIIPLFLSLGVHVKQDIPSEIALAQKQLPQQITIHLSPPLGTYSGLESLLIDQFNQLEQFNQFSPSERILLAHGSRLATANRKTEYLARQCAAQVAYWSTAPHLETVVQQQMENNPKKIAIIPYFLFPGRITDAIAQQVAQLQPQFPSTDLILGQPLGATETLAQLILDNITA